MSRIRVLQVVGGLNRGGTETWLAHLIPHLDRDRFEFHFLVHTEEPGAFDQHLKAHGARVLVCRDPRRPLPYRRNFHRILHEHGPYAVVHGHLHHFNGYILGLAAAAGVRRRIAHSHSSDAGQESWLRSGYAALARRLIERHATTGLAVSRSAARALFGPRWEKDRRWKLHPCGIDLDGFHEPASRETVRQSLGIPPGTLVIGHVGRLVDEKNHRFLFAVAAAVAGRFPCTVVCAGSGPRLAELKQLAEKLALDVRLLGDRPDVPRLLRGFDVFVFPSHREGLGLAAVEAQASGLRCLLSDGVPAEACVVPGLTLRLPLSVPAATWAGALLDWLHMPIPAPEAALAEVESSPYHLRRSAAALGDLYAG